MPKVALAARILLGLTFVAIGFNGLLNFVPLPDMGPAAGAFIGAMMGTGYLWPLLKMVEIVAGAMLLFGRYVPFALAMLAPVVVSILGFHAFVAPSGLPLGAAVMVLWLVLVIAYWHHFGALLNAEAQPADSR